jgi:hypothetical protein
MQNLNLQEKTEKAADHHHHQQQQQDKEDEEEGGNRQVGQVLQQMPQAAIMMCWMWQLSITATPPEGALHSCRKLSVRDSSSSSSNSNSSSTRHIP